VPLVNDSSSFYVTLARMRVSGATSNFPILRPDVIDPPPSPLSPYIASDYWVGLRWIAFAYATAGANSPQLTPVGYSDLITTNLLFPWERQVNSATCTQSAL
jgi:hypothetical protein